jgi:HEAT repeat protein
MERVERKWGYPKEALSVCKIVVSSLVAALKISSLYPEDHPYSQKTMSRLCSDMETFLDRYEELMLCIERDRLLFADQAVYQGVEREGDLAYALFRDGVMKLTFQRGIARWEIMGFIGILDGHRTLPPEPEGDIVTALWEADLPHILYEAVDSTVELDPDAGLCLSEKRGNLLAELRPSKAPDSLSALPLDKDTGVSLRTENKSNSLLPADLSLLELTADEEKALQEMVDREEERDATQEILDMLDDILRDEWEDDFFDVIFRYMEEELHSALGRRDFDVSLRILDKLGNIRHLHNESRSYRLSRANEVLIRVSAPNFLAVLQQALPLMSASEIEKARTALLLLPPKAIAALAPMMIEAPSSQVRSMLSDVIVSLAFQDFGVFEGVLGEAEEALLYQLVPLLGRLDGDRSAQLLVKMGEDPSERIREEALKAVIARGLWFPEKLASLIGDKSMVVRQLFMKYLASRRSEAAEKVFTDYLQDKRFSSEDDEHLAACFRALGRCCTARSLPFLQETLLHGGLFSRLRLSARRLGAAIALSELGTKRAREVLEKASHSRYPAVRGAAQKVMRSSGGER